MPSASDEELINQLKLNLRHSRAAYSFAVRNLPDPGKLNEGPISTNGFTFDRASQITSMLIELGWAFFCRYEACLEKFLRDKGLELSKKKTLEDWLEKHGVVISDERREGLKLYRRIRNQLHHQDGASLDGFGNEEIHLCQEHMERFFNLFVWIGESVQASQIRH